MTTTESQLLEMGLTAKEVADETPKFSSWDRKLSVQRAVKSSDPSLAGIDNLWRTAPVTPALNQVTCNINVHAAKVSGIVKGGAEDNTDKIVYLCKDETAEWTRQHLMHWCTTRTFVHTRPLRVIKQSYERDSFDNKYKIYFHFQDKVNKTSTI